MTYPIGSFFEHDNGSGKKTLMQLVSVQPDPASHHYAYLIVVTTGRAWTDQGVILTTGQGGIPLSIFESQLTACCPAPMGRNLIKPVTLAYRRLS